MVIQNTWALPGKEKLFPSFKERDRGVAMDKSKVRLEIMMLRQWKLNQKKSKLE